MTAAIDPAIGCELSPLTTFKFEGLNVRIQDRDGNPWWVLADICRVLEIGEPHVAARRLDEDEKDRFTAPTLGGPQEVSIVNESGLYSLILKSRKPAAKRFKKWVTAEVLPTIRKTGGYGSPAANLNDPYTLRAALLGYTERVIVLESENATLGAKVEQLAPKAAALDLLSAKVGEAGLMETSRALTGRAMALIEWMKANKWIHRSSDNAPWLPYADKGEAGTGYLVVRERADKYRENRSHPQTMVTPKGRAKLAELLAQGNLLRSNTKRPDLREVAGP